MCHLAVLKEYQGMGIASNLFKIREQKAKELGAEYLSSNTSVNAISSVKYHLKNGFQKVRYVSHPNTTYYSYAFIKRFKYHWFWSNKLFVRLYFYNSFIRTKLLRKEDGSKTMIAKLINL